MDPFVNNSLGDIGPTSSWPPPLRVALDIMQNTPLPMLLMWSRQQIMLFNEAYQAIAGSAASPPPGGRIPSMQPAAWQWNPAAIEQAWLGHSLHYPRQPLQLWHEGHTQDAIFDIHYTPLRDAEGTVTGILCALAPPTPSPLACTGEPADHRQRILVVEDNLDAQYLVCEMLRTFGHEVEAVERGEDALELLAARHFDVLFSDISLPGISGLELGRAAKQHQPGLHIVFASGYSPALTGELDFPAVTLQKPYDIEQLQRLLHDLAEGTACSQ